MKGRVLKGTNNIFSIDCEDGLVRTCAIKGKILKKSKGLYNPLAAGDFVHIEVDTHDESEGMILDLIERKNKFLRENQKTNTPQLLAANIDLLLCVTSVANPPFRPRFVDRVLVQAEIQQIPVLIVLNKSDLEITDEVKTRCEDWRRLGYTVQFASAKNKTGIDEIIEKISEKTIAAVGQSGVGKSSLLNAISPELDLKTAEISNKHDRGTHTTTQGELFKITAETSDGKKHSINLIDTPGIRSFVVSGIDARDVAAYFPELEELIVQCKFGLSCTHTKEKGCKVNEALANGEILPDRYTSWKSIYDELKGKNSWD